MINNKTRIISFLMAFLLIFTFAFVNPLAISKSYAFAPAVVLSSQGVKIIAGVLASAGLGITAGVSLQQVDYEQAVTDITNVIYRTLNGAEKIALCALSIAENIVEVPVSLYNVIVNNAKKVLQTPEYSQTLLEQGITIKYAKLTSDNVSDPDLCMPIYQITNSLSDSWVTTRERDMREAEPFLVYDGTQSTINEFGQSECVVVNYFDFAIEDNPILELNITSSTNKGYVSLTPSLSGYGLKYSTSSTDKNNCMFLQCSGTNNKIQLNLGTANLDTGSVSQTRSWIDLNKNAYFSSIPFTSLKLFYYFVRNANGLTGVHCDVYNGNEFVGQRQFISNSEMGFNSVITEETLFDTPSGLDTTINVEEMPSPVITNTDASANVLTLPTTVADSIGLTSIDVNVGVTDVPGTGEGAGTDTGEATGLLQKILDALMSLGDYILDGIKHIFMPDVAVLDDLKESIEIKFPIIEQLKGIIDEIVSILTNKYTEPPAIIIPLSKAESKIDYGPDCLTMDLSWYEPYKEKVDLVIIGFAYIFFAWRLYHRLPGIISGADGINWSVFSGEKTEYSGSGKFGFKAGGGKK